MTLTTRLLRFMFNKADKKRDRGLTTPDDIKRIDDIQYGEDPVWNALDVYYLKDTEKQLPTIVSIHGGGYVYGTKEVYQYYCMSLAQRGFTVVNFNYHLAPERRFPTQLQEINQVMEWICANSKQYFIDTNNIFTVGDSAGAMLNSQYSLMYADPEYASLFDIEIPDFRLAAIALNCGTYKMNLNTWMKGILRDYLGRNMHEHSDKLNILDRIGSGFPPTYVMSSSHDFLKAECRPMAELLISRNVPTEWKIYGEASDKQAQHVFHCNIRNPLATQCNDDETAFFRKYIIGTENI